MPGSRQGEIRRHATRYLQAATRIEASEPKTRFLVPVLNADVQRFMQAEQDRVAPNLRVQYHIDQSALLLAAADVALITSGTATLEALILDCPMVVAYRAHWLSYLLIRPLLRIRQFALPNLLAGSRVVPECIQADVTPERLADAMLDLIRDPAVRARQREAFRSIRATLAANASDRAAQAVMSFFPAPVR